MDSLLKSRRFLLAVLDALVSTTALVLTAVLSPDNLKLALQIVAIWQPVIIAVIIGLTVDNSIAGIRYYLDTQAIDRIERCAIETAFSIVRVMLFALLGAVLAAAVFILLYAYAGAETEGFFYGMSYCTGQSISELQADRGAFDRWYGKTYGVSDWGGNYFARMNEWARARDCPKPFDESTGNLTLYYRIFAEWQAALYPK